MYINREVLVPRPSVADAITILLSSRDTRVIAVRYAVTLRPIPVILYKSQFYT